MAVRKADLRKKFINLLFALLFLRHRRKLASKKYVRQFILMTVSLELHHPILLQMDYDEL